MASEFAHALFLVGELSEAGRSGFAIKDAVGRVVEQWRLGGSPPRSPVASPRLPAVAPLAVTSLAVAPSAMTIVPLPIGPLGPVAPTVAVWPFGPVTATVAASVTSVPVPATALTPVWTRVTIVGPTEMATPALAPRKRRRRARLRLLPWRRRDPRDAWARCHAVLRRPVFAALAGLALLGALHVRTLPDGAGDANKRPLDLNGRSVYVAPLPPEPSGGDAPAAAPERSLSAEPIQQDRPSSRRARSSTHRRWTTREEVGAAR